MNSSEGKQLPAPRDEAGRYPTIEGGLLLHLFFFGPWDAVKVKTRPPLSQRFRHLSPFASSTCCSRLFSEPLFIVWIQTASARHFRCFPLGSASTRRPTSPRHRSASSVASRVLASPVSAAIGHGTAPLHRCTHRTTLLLRPSAESLVLFFFPLLVARFRCPPPAFRH